jgi:hypothetical protein
VADSNAREVGWSRAVGGRAEDEGIVRPSGQGAVLFLTILDRSDFSRLHDAGRVGAVQILPQ